MKKIVFALLSLLMTTVTCADEPVTFQMNDSSLIDRVLQDQQDHPLGYDQTTHILRRFSVNVQDNLVRTRIQSIWYYPDTESVENYGTETLYFNAPSESITVFMAASVSPNADTTYFNPTTVQYGESDQYNTFSDSKVAYIALPGLSANGYAVIDYEIVTDYEQEETAYFETFRVEGSFPVKSFEVDVRWQQPDLAWNVSHPAITCSEAENNLTCSAEDIAPLDIDETTHWRDKIRGVEVSEAQDWNAVSERMLNKYNQAFTEQSLVDSLYQDLTAGLESQEQKINALHRYVSEQIRYVSLSTNGHSHTPHTNDSVIRNRYGDCKDKTALLDALLQRAGVTTQPTLVATKRTLPERLTVPSLVYFNHIVLCIDSDGRNYCLDPTDTNTHWQSTSDWIQNKVSLPLTSEATPGVIEPSTYRWQLNIATKLYFTPEGGLEETQIRTYSGEFAAHIRYQLRGENEETQRDLLRDQYQNVVADIDTVQAALKAGVGSDYETLVVETQAQFAPFIPVDSILEYVEPDGWIRNELNDNLLENKYDAVVLSGVKYISEYEIDVSEHWQLTKPTPDINLNHRFGTFIRDSDIREGKMFVTTTLSIPQQTISLEEQQEYNRLMAIFRDLHQIRVEAPLKER